MNSRHYQQSFKHERLGQALSEAISCAVRYYGEEYQKPLYVCKCGVHFFGFAIEGAMLTGNWTAIVEEHRKVNKNKGESNGETTDVD